METKESFKAYPVLVNDADIELLFNVVKTLDTSTPEGAAASDVIDQILEMEWRGRGEK